MLCASVYIKSLHPLPTSIHPRQEPVQTKEEASLSIWACAKELGIKIYILLLYSTAPTHAITAICTGCFYLFYIFSPQQPSIFFQFDRKSDAVFSKVDTKSFTPSVAPHLLTHKDKWYGSFKNVCLCACKKGKWKETIHDDLLMTRQKKITKKVLFSREEV